MKLRSPSKRKGINKYSPDNQKHNIGRNNNRTVLRRDARAEKSRTDYGHGAEMEKRRSSNLELYKKMKMSGKIRFARNGYCFLNNPGEPAIIMAKTLLETSEGMDRGIRVGSGLPKLPVGFLIFYSHYEISDQDQESNDTQSLYQVGLKNGKVMKVHTEPTEDYGLANFINSTMRSGKKQNGNPIPDGLQDLRISNCELIQSQSGLSKATKKKYPAYVKVTRSIPQGHELLMRYGSGYKIIGKNNDST